MFVSLQSLSVVEESPYGVGVNVLDCDEIILFYLKILCLIFHDSFLRCIAITYWISKSLRQFQMPVQKSLETYWIHHVNGFKYWYIIVTIQLNISHLFPHS